ncbi:MAG: DUF2934 domain-containing protein [Polyangiaceae bacterium]
MSSSKRSKASRSKSSSSQIAAAPAPATDGSWVTAILREPAPAKPFVFETPALPRPATPKPALAKTAAPSPTPKITVPETASQRQAPSPEEMRRMVAQLAYSRAENIGFGRTNPVEDWLWAEQEVRRRFDSRAA